VADLQDFARPLTPRIEETDLKIIIGDLLKKNDLPENVKVEVKVESDARKFVADSSYIKPHHVQLGEQCCSSYAQRGQIKYKKLTKKKVTLS